MDGLTRGQYCEQLRKWENPAGAGRATLTRLRRRFSFSRRSMFRADSRFALVAACALAAACSDQPHGAATRVIIPRGASFAQAADSLARTGLIGSPRMFRLYGRVTGGDRNIKPGTYL